MKRMIEYDKRIGVPDFKGWEDREIEASAYRSDRHQKIIDTIGEGAFYKLEHILIKLHDGGRDKYFKGTAGDCGTRAICNATGMDYKEVYQSLQIIQKSWGKKKTKNNLKIRRSSVREGTYMCVMRAYLEHDLGWTWVPTSGIGVRETIHLKEDELPKGRIILRVSKHYTAAIDGMLIDTYDCTRGGTRKVYGYWIKK